MSFSSSVSSSSSPNASWSFFEDQQRCGFLVGGGDRDEAARGGERGLVTTLAPLQRGEGHERRYFYGSVWAVTCAQPVLWLLWQVLPQARAFTAIKLLVFVSILGVVGNLARRGLLPRTRPIVAGEWAISD